jgi:hypothetical protein
MAGWYKTLQRYPFLPRSNALRLLSKARYLILRLLFDNFLTKIPKNIENIGSP